MLRRNNRPQLLQSLLDARKRLRGAPTGGMVSVVVTDIEGFSGENRVLVGGGRGGGGEREERGRPWGGLKRRGGG